MTKFSQHELFLSIPTLRPILRHRFRPLAAATVLGLLASAAQGESSAALELYVDTQTKQVFTEPGPHRVKLGSFVPAQTGAATQSPAEGAPRPTVAVGKNGLEVISEDGNFAVTLGGRIHIDASSHLNDDLVERGTNNSVEAVSGSEIRRARLALKGTVYEDYHFVIEGDWAGNSVSLKDTLVSYTGFDGLEFTVGHQKHAISMELQESSNDIMFNERSLLSAITTPHFDRALGINLKTDGDDWSLQGGIYGDSIADSGDEGDEGAGLGLRATFAPINTPSHVIHLGANAGYRKANDSNSLSNSKAPRFRYETTPISDLYLSDTGAVDGFEEISLGILEAAAVSGPFSLQSEVGQASISRATAADLDFSAYYVQMGWTLTGETRRYKGADGEFKRLKPRNAFKPGQDQWGAWELALRIDGLDLEDGDVNGGEQQRLSVNLNWYLNETVRVLLGYSRAFDVDNGPLTQPGGADPDDVDVIMLRTQLAL